MATKSSDKKRRNGMENSKRLRAKNSPLRLPKVSRRPLCGMRALACRVALSSYFAIARRRLDCRMRMACTLVGPLLPRLCLLTHLLVSMAWRWPMHSRSAPTRATEPGRQDKARRVALWLPVWRRWFQRTSTFLLCPCVHLTLGPCSPRPWKRREILPFSGRRFAV